MGKLLTTKQIHNETGRHVVTIRKALEGGVLHGMQTKLGAPWLIDEECVRPWLSGEKCSHKSNVVPIRRGLGMAS